MSTDLIAIGRRLRAQALGYPEAVEETPWGERVVKVRKKVFVFVGISAERLSITLKLPHSSAEALTRGFATPTGYGLGRHGWVSCSFEAGTPVPEAQLLDWMDESFRAVAPKRVSRALAEGQRPPPRPEPAPIVMPEGDPRVLLVGDDPLRLERAARRLADRGVPSFSATADEALEVAGDLDPPALLVDLSRNAGDALARASELSALCFQAALFVTGLRDAQMERHARELLPGGVELSRDAPGEAAVIDRVTERVSAA